MTVRDILTEVSKLSPAERAELERLWQQAFADEVRQRRLAELRAEVEAGLRQLDTGHYTEITYPPGASDWSNARARLSEG